MIGWLWTTPGAITAMAKLKYKQSEKFINEYVISLLCNEHLSCHKEYLYITGKKQIIKFTKNQSTQLNSERVDLQISINNSSRIGQTGLNHFYFSQAKLK